MTVSEQLGESFLEPKVDISVLSKRETEVLVLLCRGFTRAAVAKQLYRSPKTIDNHCTRIYHKLGVQSQAQLVSIVYRQGLITPQVGSPDQGVQSSEPSFNERIYKAFVPFENRLERCPSESFFTELVAGLADAVGVEMAGITEVDTASGEAVVAFSSDRGVPSEPVVCALESTACSRTFRLGEFICERGAAAAFPDSEIMRVQRVESYAGVRLDARVLGTVGCLWVADRKPFADPAFVHDVLRLLRRRVSTEMAFRAVIDEDRRVL